MSAIPFTDRELKRAWRDLSIVARPVSGGVRKNPIGCCFSMLSNVV